MTPSYKLVINHTKLEEWCELHEVIIPQVDIVQHIPVNGGKEPFGDYEEKTKRIRVRRLTPKELKRMNSTLWHELRHHLQATTMPQFYYVGSFGSYRDRPIEKDARRYAVRALRKYGSIIEVVK